MRGRRGENYAGVNNREMGVYGGMSADRGL